VVQIVVQTSAPLVERDGQLIYVTAALE